MSATLHHIAFYQFVELHHPDRVAVHVRSLATSLGLTGSVLIATEGINGVLAGEAEALDRFEASMREDPAFLNLWFKRTACQTQPFTKLKVHIKAEIVDLGVSGVRVQSRDGQRLTPQQWRDLLNIPNTVVIDNRNAFEFRLGHFKGAINPDVDNFRDFPRFIAENAAEWINEGKQVAMYCTGGIRCEKTSAWLAQSGLRVLELDGGILNYLATLPDARNEWLGECFVFDNRVALDSQLHETGTTEEVVYDDTRPDEAWRLKRALRLRAALAKPSKA